MSNQRFRRGRCPIHPLFFALYPVLSLLATNAYEVRLAESVRSLLAAFLLCALIFGIMYLVRRDAASAAVLSSVILVEFFSYGHVYDWGRQLGPEGLQVFRHRFLLLTFIVTFACLTLVVRRLPRLPGSLTAGLNAVGLALIIIPLVTVVRSEHRFRSADDVAGEPVGECSLSTSAGTPLRDIYYIVLDAYARQDVLAHQFKFNNRPFLNALEQRGFVVFETSQSNYASTGMSLASTLNMSYLPIDSRTANETPLDYWDAIAANEVRTQLECLGYQIVAFDSGYDWSSWRGADVFLSPTQGRQGTLVGAGLNSFEAFLVNSTMLRVLVDAAILLPGVIVPDLQGPIARHRSQIEYAFDTLEQDVLQLNSPKFVFAHVIAPHRPYVFGPQGRPRDPDDLFTLRGAVDTGAEAQRRAYTDQLQYVNDRTLSVVDSLLSGYPAEAEPIIILQSDHGPTDSASDRMRILNALHLPGGRGVPLTESMSPVNTFRLVFANYFGARYELLPDVSCYSTYNEPFEFRLVPNPLAKVPSAVDPSSFCE